MSRPIYESEASLRAEKSVADEIQRNRPDLTVIKTSKLCRYDYVLKKGDRIAYIAEIKCRRNAKDEYPTYMIGLKKIASCLIAAQSIKVPFIIFVGFKDGIYSLINFSEHTFGTGGRTDRGDSCDMETCVYFPMKNFRKL